MKKRFTILDRTMKTQTVEAEKASELFAIAKEKQWTPIMIIGIEPIYEQAGEPK